MADLRLTPRRVALVVAAVAAVAYLPSLTGGFLYDDNRVVVENRAIRELGSLGTVLRAEPSRPLLSLTWALNYAVGGLRPWPYHLVNLALHAANAALLALLLLWMGERAGRKQALSAALAGACLFAASPMAADTVAYVSSRSTALASLVVLTALRVALPLLDAFSPRRLAAVLGLLLLGLASKEEAAVFPLLLLLLDLAFVARGDLTALRGRARVHGPLLLVPVLGLVARAVVTGAWLPPPALPLGRYLATQVAVFPQYLLRLLLPLDPAFYRGHPAAGWPPQAWVVAGWLAAAALAAGAVLGRRRWPEWSFAVAWLAIALLPSSSLVPLKEMVVDHRAYLGALGVAYVTGGLVWRRGRWRLLVVLVLVWAAVAWRYQWVLADPARAWQDAVARAPQSAEAWRALGDALAVRRDPRAESALRNAVALAPQDPAGWTNLGAFYAERGRPEEALRAMGYAARAAPWESRIRHNRATLLLALGREDEAMAELEAAIAGRPPLGEPRIDLAALLLDRGQPARARKLIDEALRLPLDPADAERAYEIYGALPASDQPR